MRILISTGIYPPEIGGPALYAKRLAEEFERADNAVRVIFFGFEKKLPSFVRHAVFALRVLPQVIASEAIVAMDTMGAGFPTIFLAWVFRKKTVMRIGGDFLWEMYVERTHVRIPLDDFYADPNFKSNLTLKERLIFSCTKFALSHAGVLAFTTEWQRDLWMPVYGIPQHKCTIIRNFMGEKLPPTSPSQKNFLWAGRPIFLKNVEFFKKAFEAAKVINQEISFECIQVSHEELEKRIASCYAVVAPSLSEVSPNLILDAIRFDKPFMLTKHNGLPKNIQEAGLLIDPLDGHNIREKILELAKDDVYKAVKQKVEAIRAVHSWEEIAKEFIETLRR